MKIMEFSRKVLHAPRKPRAWGSCDPVAKRVFLGVWDDQLSRHNGGEKILVLRAQTRNRSNPGRTERKKHIELIKAGYAAYGVLQTCADPNTTGKRKIKKFNDSELLRFGNTFIMQQENTYAQIVGRISIEQLPPTTTTLVHDLNDIIESQWNPTVREALINARVGQGQFREQVFGQWKNRCAVTGTATLDAVRASHIKPWRFCNDQERLDPSNGIPLIANLDALFDAGLISFESSGRVIVSSILNATERQLFGLGDKSLSRVPTMKTVEYLTYHRKQIFRK